MDEENANGITQSSNNGDSALQNTAKKIMDNAGKKAVKDGAVKGKVAAILAPYIMWVAVILVCVMILIGIIMFFMTMPGMVMDKIKSLFNDLGNYIAAFFGADTSAQIKEENIYETLNYLEDMGYDVKGYGFLTGYYTEDDKNEIEKRLSQEEKDAGYVIDTERGVVRSKEENKIILAKSDFIFTYIASDNYIYTLKNKNIATQPSDSSGVIGFIKSCFSAVATYWYKVTNYLYGPLYDFLGVTNAVQGKWGKGLISLYYEGNTFGKRGNAVNTDNIWNNDTAKIDMKNKQLILAKNGWFSSNQPMKYNLDGWTGRYGMPVEFLLSVHIATLMPDLAYNMATGFDTTVNIYLSKAKGVVSTSDGKGYNSSDYETYMPYIASVENHWYRDVYYVVDLDRKEDKNVQIIDYDYEYELLRKERWTLYETYTPEENKAKAGEFKLYVTRLNGEYATLDDIKADYAEIAFKSDETLKDEIKKDPTGNTEYYLFEGSKEEADSLGIKIAKKAVTIAIDKSDETEEKLNDLGWNRLNNIWTAYKSSAKGSYKVKETVEDDDGNKIEREVELVTGTFKQTGEGQRTETNAKIKKMFLTDTYFRYSGASGDTDEIITALRDKIAKDVLKTNGVKYGALNELVGKNNKTYDVTDKKYSATDLGLTEDRFKVETIDENGEKVKIDKEFAVKDYSGQVSLNQDSLNAFSMLENTHTEDADYIYRDFKELVVELSYFTKEELTDEIPRVMEWPVPDTGSENYPNRVIDKNSNEYGTMIHSKGDINARKTEILLENNERFESEQEEDAIAAYDPVQQTDQEEQPKPEGKLTPQSLFKQNTETHEDLIAGITAMEFVDKAREVWEEMSQLGYDYCVGNLVQECSTCSATCRSIGKCQRDDPKKCSCRENHCNHSVHNNSCGLQRTFEDSKINPTTKCNVCCATFVSWVLIELDVDVTQIMAEIGGNPNGAYSVSRMCVEYLGAEIIENYEDLQPGDIMAYVRKGDSDIGHVDILGEKTGDTFIKYNGGASIQVGAKPNTFNKASFNNNELCFGMRLFGLYNENAYVGYNGNEMVVSPVTGILLEYGTYDPNQATGKDWDSISDVAYRLNTDLKYGAETSALPNKSEFESLEVSDKVGYAKILVLDEEYYKALEHSTDNRWNEFNGGTSLVNENGTYREELIDDDESKAADKLRIGGWSDIDKLVYGYKEFAELYQKSGISGYIVYVDGFVCEEPDTKLGHENKAATQIPYENKPEEKAKKQISTADYYDGFESITYKKVTPDNFKDNRSALKTKYKEDVYNKIPSEKISNKLKAEIKVKATAARSLYLDENISKKVKSIDEHGTIEYEPIIFIKEGTILGRTMTDKELLETEYFRNSEYGTYEDNRQRSFAKNKEELDKVIGNYLRIIMRDTNGQIVENVEDYLKLDVIDEFDWFELFYWTPFESGGADLPYQGPECVSTCSPGETAVGLIQDTDLVGVYHPTVNDKGEIVYNDGGQIASFFRKCIAEDPILCAPLSACAYGEWNSAVTTWSDILGETDPNGTKTKFQPTGTRVLKGVTIPVYQYDRNCPKISGSSKLQQVLHEVCEIDRETFLHIQMKIGKKDYLDDVILKDYPWMEKRPLCVQGVVMHYAVWTGHSPMELGKYENATDEEIIDYVRYLIANTASTVNYNPSGNTSAGRAWNEPEIAKGILDGRLCKSDVEEWVRTANSKILTSCGIDYRSN